jgi:hypothetical protein
VRRRTLLSAANRTTASGLGWGNPDAGRQRGERQPTGHATPLGAGAASRGHLREKVAPLHRPAAVSGTAGWPSRYSATGTPAARPH